jgi:hypothetical protein
MKWLLLILSLPTRPSAVRVRIWRTLRTTGCAALRDGVYLLPDRPDCAATFARAQAEAQAAGGVASVLAASARDADQETAWVALFDRSADHKTLVADMARCHQGLRKASEPAARRALRALTQRLEALQAIDFFAAEAAERTTSAFATLRFAVEARFSPGEPTARAASALPRLDAADYRGRTWATRRRPWVDRLASAWLIRRFVDPQARFVWIASPDKAPKRALGFDFDGAAFTHVGNKTTFEVLAASFGLDRDIALSLVGDAVHALDIGGSSSAEAAGLQAVIRGLRVQHPSDDGLLNAACILFDALYAGLEEAT